MSSTDQVEAPVTAGTDAPNLQLDPATGEMVSKRLVL